MALFGGKKKDNRNSQNPPEMPPMPIDQTNPYDNPGGYAPQQQGRNYPDMQYQDQMAMPQQEQQFQQQPQMEQNDGVEETVEAIIEEKWKDLLKEISKIKEWKEKTDATINRVQQELQDLKTSVDSLNRNILSKVSDYDQNIKNVGVDIKAMEQVFQKILPQFTDNVNKLARITDKVSKK